MKDIVIVNKSKFISKLLNKDKNNKNKIIMIIMKISNWNCSKQTMIQIKF